MTYQATCRKTRLLGQAAALAILAGAVAGCSADVTRFGDVFGPTDNQDQIVRNQTRPADPMTTGSLPPPATYAAPAAPVVSSTVLPPPPGATASNAPYVRPDGTRLTPALPAPPAAPQATASAAPWTPTDGTSITVREGETLQVISRRYGVPESALMAANGLRGNTPLHGGQTLVIPAYKAPGAAAAAAQPVPNAMPPSAAMPAQTAAAAAPGMGTPPAVLGQLPPMKPQAPIATQVAAAAAQPGAPGLYTVKAGDSLGKIAAAHGLRSADILKANGLNPDQPIRIGQTLKIPAGAAPAQVASATPTSMSDTQAALMLPTAAPKLPTAAAPAPAKVATAPAAAPAAPQASAPAAPQQVAAAAPQAAKPEMPVSAGVQSAADGSFRWPVRGRVISGYGAKPGGERNDGINIEVPEGTPIKATEAGEVIYAGNELKGFGNLVLVKHTNGFVSAYAHASEILVRRGDRILRGQTIAKVGSTGNVTRPQLHFEIREGNKPVDPLPYLSG